MSPEVRRLIAKLVLFVAGVWVLFLAAVLRGPFDPIRFPLFLIPGCAFVPAAYYAILLHRGDHSDRSWKFLVIYAIAGVVLMIGSGNGLHQLPPASDL
jgi:predicted membrane channel-forming protein YqfA (hemolysin III family)